MTRGALLERGVRLRPSKTQTLLLASVIQNKSPVCGSHFPHLFQTHRQPRIRATPGESPGGSLHSALRGPTCLSLTPCPWHTIPTPSLSIPEPQVFLLFPPMRLR